MMIAVSIAILFLASGLSVTANGSQNSGQNNTAGYVKYTLDLLNNTLINGNFVNTHNAMNPWGIAYDPSNGYLYVTDWGSGTVSVINGKTNTVIATIPVGIWPVGVAYDPSNGYIYVTNYASGTVSIISTSVSTSSTSSVSTSSSTSVSTSSTSTSSVTMPTTSTSTSVSTSSTSISSVTTPTTSTSTKPTPSVLPTLVVVVVVVVVVSIVALLMIKHRKP